MQILDGVKDRYESFHKVRYRAEALRTAIYQSSRYITDRHLPDKAIDVIDEAGAQVKLRRVRDTQNLRRLEQEIRQVVKEMKVAISDKDFERAVYLREREIELREDLERMSVAADETGVLEVTRHDIEEVISSWTGIPVAAPAERGGRAAAAHGGHPASRRVVGQDRAISRDQPRHPPLAPGGRQPAAAGGLVHLPRPLGRRQDRGGAPARRVPVRQPAGAGALRHVASTWRSTRSPS